MPQINWKLDVGHILTITVLLGGFLIQYGSISNRIAVIELSAARQTDLYERAVTKQAELYEKLATVVYANSQLVMKVQTQLEERQRLMESRQDRSDSRIQRSREQTQTEIESARREVEFQTQRQLAATAAALAGKQDKKK